MGRFSTTVHIKNNVDRMRFTNTFCDVMKKRGFVPCTEDEAAQSYLFAFGEGWVTLANEEYKDNPQKAYDDTREMAAALKTSAFSVEVVDSDFALLKLCNPDGCEDEVVIGDGSGYGVEEAEGTQEHWEPLLANGKTWKQFSEMRLSEETFVEDSLCEAAGILEIDPYYICADFDEVMDKADGGNNVTAFYFKKATAKDKAMSLNTAFKKAFATALKPLGFKLIKSKYPYFVRMINGEIVQVITLRRYAGGDDWGEFEIKYGAATVYRRRIDFNSPPQQLDWLSTLYSEEIRNYNNVESFNSIFKYYEYVKKGIMAETIDQAVSLTIKEIIPQFDAANDLKSCMSFFLKHNQPVDFSLHYERPDFSNNYPYFDSNEGLLWIFVKDRNMYQQETFPNLAEFDEIFSDEIWLGKAEKELKRRKCANLEILKTYGIMA